MRRTTQIFIATAIWLLTVSVSGAATLEFDRASLLVDAERGLVTYADFDTLPISVSLQVPVSRILIPLGENERIGDLWYDVSSQTPVGLVDASLAVDQPTAESAELSERILHDVAAHRSGSEHIVVQRLHETGGVRFAEVAVYPVIATIDGELLLVDGVELFIGDRRIAPEDMALYESLAGHPANRIAERVASGVGPDYVIVTSAEFVPVLERLAKYRRACGYKTEVQTIESIISSYSGRDDAERLREYLKDFYADGGRSLLLAGDETVLPIRYAYYYNAYSEISLDMLQICDLYFADLTGEWDVDNDGIWGERSQDAADLTPELLVGRLPLNDSLEFENYIDNLVSYETKAGGSDRSWLTRTFFYSSDQMRDYETTGQHEYISRAFPSTFTVDTTLAVEQSSGIDANPQNADGAQLPSQMADGYGIWNVIAHGRPDGYVIRSSGYNEWPKNYMLTDEENGGHGCLDSTLAAGKPGFWYSLACDNGGFDQDQPPFSGGRTMVQHLLGAADGAIGMVAYSRWGWVGSSHLLQKAFLDSLFAHPDRPAVEAMYASKQAIPYYRDLILGQNYFGDPLVRVYTDAPADLTLSPDRTEEETIFVVRTGSFPVGDAVVSIVDDDGALVAGGQTDADGRVAVNGLSTTELYTVGVTMTGYTTNITELGPSIITDVEDDDELLPTTFSLSQNYPNPFNPSTTISFSLPEAAHVTLTIYNTLGQEVDRLIDDVRSAGGYEIEWRAENRLASGVYFYRLEAGDISDVRKMILLQ
ncbi:T9SS type A sorting domain-containing protein [bacterium]|nr:T9SS type A sorting domain-containing protein [bacterium]